MAHQHSPTQQLFRKYRQQVEDVTRWLRSGNQGLSKLSAYVRLQPPTPELAYVMYELTADLRHSPPTDTTLEEVEFVLDEIRSFLSNTISGVR